MRVGDTDNPHGGLVPGRFEGCSTEGEEDGVDERY
jgi:hypothetical protein